MSVVMRAIANAVSYPAKSGTVLGGRDAGLVAQLVERCPCTAEATGSNPVESKSAFERMCRDIWHGYFV